MGQEKIVCNLNKALYGLKRASRQWYSKFSTSLLAVGFHQSKIDYSLFTKTKKHGLLAVLVYVDDILVGCNDLSEVETLESYLHSQFMIKDTGNFKFFLIWRWSDLLQEFYCVNKSIL